MIGSGGSVFASIEEFAEFVGKFFVMFGRILAGLGSDFDGEQVHDNAVFIGRPNACVFAKERCARRLFTAEAH